MVKLNKLWGDAKFSLLSPFSKFIYLYFISNPTISTLGVIDILIGKIYWDTGLEERQIRNSIKELKDSKYIIYLEDTNNKERVQIVVLDHFKSLSKSKLNLRKALSEGKLADERLKQVFRQIYVKSDFENNNFTPPTPEEVSKYAMSLGYEVNGNTFCSYYGDNDWYNKNNKKVRNWKRTLEKVWCRDSNKINLIDGAPKGFENFYVLEDNGNRIFPESWKNSLPSHNNFLYSELLVNHYNNIIAQGKVEKG